VLALPAARARPELWCQACRNQQLQTECQGTRTRGLGRPLVEQGQLATEQVEYTRVRLRSLEQPSHRVTRACCGIERVRIPAQG